MTPLTPTGIWILAEQAQGRILRISHELLTRARELADKRGSELTAVVLGDQLAREELDELIARGADRVLVAASPLLAQFLVEPYAACLVKAIADYRPEVIIAGATTTGRTLMPYVAIKVNAGLTADCTGLDIDPATGNLLQTRPAIGGNIMATIQTPKHRPQMATVRPRSTKPAARQTGRTGRIEQLALPATLSPGRMRHVAFVKSTDTHALAEAERVVSAGRGVKKGENIHVVRALADTLDAALGASRDAVDRGWLNYPHQVGLSGKTVSPRLYVAIGISGAIQHLAGMQTADVIIAVNSDPDAQIFKVADFGIVGNLFEVVPVLVRKLKQAQDKAAEN